MDKTYPNLSLEEAKELMRTSSEYVIRRRKEQITHLENTVICREMLEKYQEEAQRNQLILSDTQQNFMLSQGALFCAQTQLAEIQQELHGLKENYEIARAHLSHTHKIIREKDEYISQKEKQLQLRTEEANKTILHLKNTLQAQKAIEGCLKREQGVQLQQAFLLPCQSLNTPIGESIPIDHIPYWLARRYPRIGSGNIPLTIFDLYVLSEFLCEELTLSPEQYLKIIREKHVVLSMTTEKRYPFLEAAQDYAANRVEK